MTLRRIFHLQSPFPFLFKSKPGSVKTQALLKVFPRRLLMFLIFPLLVGFFS
ncbi:hypothetical protein NSE_0949 [Neorickettsia sennetsu str. Miyayama]|uniref:Uncharacterized protein n=1 Tax=Ehrlichia sennetsu (strain ATCC VR-367 / Miyayama) TaxID=222891 RepID=Q2GCI3_EHRS3|nr:hypothetical protein NSE_0949 [Neorickettsia sennetsu str. Miyayama]